MLTILVARKMGSWYHFLLLLLYFTFGFEFVKAFSMHSGFWEGWKQHSFAVQVPILEYNM